MKETEGATGGAAVANEPAKDTSAQQPAQQTSTQPQPRDENKTEGPCGLPFKCSVS